MRVLLITAIFAVFSTHLSALDQHAVNLEIANIKQKAASGQDIKGDIAALTEKLKANAKSLVVTNQVNLSVIDQSGDVSLFVPFPATTHVIANNPDVLAHAKDAIAKHPEANKAHNFEDGAVSLGGGSKKKKDSAATDASASGSSGGGITDLIGAGISAVANAGISAVTGFIGGIL